MIIRSTWMNVIDIDMRCLFFFFLYLHNENRVLRISFNTQVNPDVIGILEEGGLKFVGKDESGNRMEVCFSHRRQTSSWKFVFFSKGIVMYLCFGKIEVHCLVADFGASKPSILCRRTISPRVQVAA